jgi:hypothetical protein
MYKTPPPFDISAMFVVQGLTFQEKEVLESLSEAFNRFVQLPDKRGNDDANFASKIDDLNALVAIRVARRIDKDVWTQP